MSDLNMSIRDIDWKVYFTYTPGELPIIHLAPEDCHPGSPAEVELEGVYSVTMSNVESEWDFLEVLDSDVLDEMETYILENINE